MLVLRAVLFNIYLQIWTICMAFVCAPTLFFSSRIIMRFAQVWAGGVTFGAALFMGVRAEIRGREHLADKRVIVAAKHQSAWETIKLSNLVDLPATVLKRELAEMFLYGYYFRRAGMIPIDREKGAGAIRAMIRLAAKRLDEGRTIIIYPEGTRTPIGQKPRYFPGVAGLYKDLGVPVVPVALNSALYWRRGRFSKIPGRIIIEALPPIPPGLDRKTFLRELEERIETATARLVEEGRADLAERGYDSP
ncbi:MAG: lysophospholipid acyltransferase family protein [Rhodospirillales bacterium]